MREGGPVPPINSGFAFFLFFAQSTATFTAALSTLEETEILVVLDVP